MKPVPSAILPLDVPKRILFLNDVSFQYGAGIAQARQIQSLLSLGVEVGVLAWSPGGIELETVATRPVDPELWLGIREVNHLEGGAALSDEAVIAGLLLEVARFDPAAIIVGNLHAARWPFALLPALQQMGCRVIAFLHDGYLFTGRCAYPGTCRLYLTGCNETCPTAQEYPALAPALIADAWKIRRTIFSGPHGVEVVANSHWNETLFRTALPHCHRVETAYLGADEMVFKPGDKTAARAQLGLPGDKPLVLCAAVNFQEKRKGCEYLTAIIAALKDTCNFAAFGHNAAEIPGLTGLGYHLEAAKLATIYQAADLFLGTATEEAFGQTVMEAQLCGLPVVAFQAGGVTEIIRGEITGKLVRIGDTAGAVAAIRSILGDPHFFELAGTWGRQCAVHRFSLDAQQRRWHVYFAGRPQMSPGHNPPTIAYPLNETDSINSMGRHRPSWSGPGEFLTEEHAQIFARTESLPGWQTPGDSFKLYEMGYHAGDVIMEIGTYGGRSATVELRGALANPDRTLAPQFYGIDIDGDSINRTRQSLANEMLINHSHLFHGVLQEFVQRWSIIPTMVFLDGDHTYAGVAADLATLSRYLKPGTPILVHDYLVTDNETGAIGVRRAVDEWAQSGQARFMGCFGCSALYLTLEKNIRA